MSTLMWILVGVGAFWILATLLKMWDVLPDRFGVHGPLITIHTGAGRDVIDRIASPKRFWRAWGNFGLGIAIVVMLGSLIFLIVVGISTVLNPPEPTPINQPQNVLVIPGVNRFLPLSVAPEIILGLIIGLIVHEGGHGILCRVEDIDIESLGLLFFTIIPAGAFVEPDERSQETASRGAKSRMFAAGVTNNFAITIVAFLLLFGPIIGAISVVSGATIGGNVPNSPAERFDIGRGDVITKIEGKPIASNDDLRQTLRRTPGETVSVTLQSGAKKIVPREVIVTGVIPNNPADLKPGDRIISANGTNISTYHDLYQIAKQNTIISVTTAEGKTTTFPAGALVFVNEGGPLAKAGAPITAIVITSVEDTRIVTTNDLLQALQHTDPGEQVTVTAYVNGSRHQYVVTLGNDPDDSSGFLGVTTGAVGISGVLINDLGVQFYPAGNYLSALGGTCERCPEFSLSFIERIFVSLQFPLIGLAGGSAFPYNFAGFTGGIANFYTITGPLSVLGSLVFLFANVLFWTGWININLAFFNCIPTFALDGGSMFRTAMEGITARMPIGGGQQLAMTVTIAVQIVMLASLFLLLFGAQLLN